MIQTVIRNDEITPGTFLLAVERLHDFQPGETVKVGLDDKLPPRIYSICSGNTENELRILYNVKEDGALTPLLARAKPGDSIIVSKPGGSFFGTTDPVIATMEPVPNAQIAYGRPRRSRDDRDDRHKT